MWSGYIEGRLSSDGAPPPGSGQVRSLLQHRCDPLEEVVALGCANRSGRELLADRLGRGRATQEGSCVRPGREVGRGLVGGRSRPTRGAALEEISHNESGQLRTTTFMDYLLPTAAECPDVRAIVFERAKNEASPIGVKGAGEAGIVGLAPAMANAIADALLPSAPPLTELPLTPSRIASAIATDGESTASVTLPNRRS